MNLLDHHHLPVSEALPWTSFHARWAGFLADDLNPLLPPHHFADSQVRRQIEIDVTVIESIREAAAQAGKPAWTPAWVPPPAPVATPFTVETDETEARVYSLGSDGRRLVAAVELVSPANKDRPETRAAFVTKCERLLQQGVGLVVVDTVTSQHFNLHNELMDRIGQPDGRLTGHLYAASYRAVGGDGVGELQAWPHPLALGQPMPTLPLWLYGGLCVPARLQETYAETCRKVRMAERLPVAEAA